MLINVLGKDFEDLIGPIELEVVWAMGSCYCQIHHYIEKNYLLVPGAPFRNMIHFREKSQIKMLRKVNFFGSSHCSARHGFPQTLSRHFSQLDDQLKLKYTIGDIKR